MVLSSKALAKKRARHAQQAKCRKAKRHKVKEAGGPPYVAQLAKWNLPPGCIEWLYSELCWLLVLNVFVELLRRTPIKKIRKAAAIQAAGLAHVASVAAALAAAGLSEPVVAVAAGAEQADADTLVALSELEKLLE
jgi:hypothetical protein